MFPLSQVDSKKVSSFITKIRLQMAESTARKSSYYNFDFVSEQPFSGSSSPTKTSEDTPRFSWTSCSNAPCPTKSKQSKGKSLAQGRRRSKKASLKKQKCE